MSSFYAALKNIERITPWVKVKNMDFGKDIINPALMLAISRLKENNSLENQNKLAAEAINARYIVPCVMRFKPGTEKEKVRNVGNTTPSFPLVTGPDEKNYLLAFTDMEEVKKWKDEPGQNVMIMRFDDLADLVLNEKSSCQGFVLNIAGARVTFQQEVIQNIIINRDQAIKDGKLREMTKEEREAYDKGEEN